MPANTNTNIHLSWQATLTILALVTAGIAGGILGSEWTDPGGKLCRQICGELLAGGVAVAVVAIAARVLAVRESTARTAVLVRVGIGLGVIGFACIITLISASYGVFSAGGSKWFLVPTGFYIGGIATIAKALSPASR